MSLSTDFTPLSLAILPRRQRSLLVRAVRLLGIAAVLLGIAALVAWLVLTQPGTTPAPAPAALVNNSAVRASPERLQAHVRTLSQDIPGRSFDQPAQLQKAADYIASQLSALGATPRRDVFKVGSNRYENIVLRLGPTPGQPGGDAPLLVIGAHYDAVRTNGADNHPPDAHSHTPGADDNASGVAGLLELARLLIAHPPTQPVELVAYTLEEPPQFRTPDMGSYHHAAQLAQSDQALRLMLSLEMLGYFDDTPGSQQYPVPGMTALYPNAGNFIALIGELRHFAPMRETKALMQGGAQLDAAGTPPLPIHSLNAPANIQGVDFSDHHNYWRFGYPALMVTDTSFMRNPHYHRSTDTWQTLDYRRMAQAVNAVLLVALAAPASTHTGVHAAF